MPILTLKQWLSYYRIRIALLGVLGLLGAIGLGFGVMVVMTAWVGSAITLGLLTGYLLNIGWMVGLGALAIAPLVVVLSFAIHRYQQQQAAAEATIDAPAIATAPHALCVTGGQGGGGIKIGRAHV